MFEEAGSLFGSLRVLLLCEATAAFGSICTVTEILSVFCFTLSAWVRHLQSDRLGLETSFWVRDFGGVGFCLYFGGVGWFGVYFVCGSLCFWFFVVCFGGYLGLIFCLFIFVWFGFFGDFGVLFGLGFFVWFSCCVCGFGCCCCFFF